LSAPPNIILSGSIKTNIQLENLGPQQPEKEALVFDKATEAASLEDLKRSIETIVAELTSLAENPNPENEKIIARLEAQKERLLERIEVEPQRLEEVELTDKR
jgi:hypothetical protein